MTFKELCNLPDPPYHQREACISRARLEWASMTVEERRGSRCNTEDEYVLRRRFPEAEHSWIPWYR